MTVEKLVANLSVPARAIWAKKSKGDRFEWLPLWIHHLDVMASMNVIWDQRLAPGLKALLAKELGSEQSALKFLRFLAMIHDEGKISNNFQTRPSFVRNQQLDDIILEKLQRAGVPYNQISSQDIALKCTHALCGEALLLYQYNVHKSVASIIGSHHGKPIMTTKVTDARPEIYPNVYHCGREGKAVWNKIQDEYFRMAINLSGYESAEEIPAISQHIAFLCAGILIMADWIGSNEAYFPLVSVDDDGTEMDFVLRNQVANDKLQLTQLWNAVDYSDTSRAVDPFFDLTNERFGFDANLLQETVLKAMRSVEKPGILIIEAPMGMGKTEAALLAAEIMADRTGRSGLYFALPTQATSDGIFGRILSWIESATSEDADAKHSFKLLHGKAHLNENYAALQTQGGEIGIDEEHSSSVIVHSWFEGSKKSLLADFVVGTVDHLLLATLKQKHLMLRHLGLANKVLVIDEVHAYDAFMSSYLSRALYWLSAYGVPVVILSATLPAERRQELLDSYCHFKSGETTDWSTNLTYPLLTYNDGQKILQKSFNVPNSDKKTVRVIGLGRSDVSDLLQDLTSDGGYAGVIVNTVRRAQELYEELREVFPTDEIRLLHSQFLATQRLEIERDILSRIGKGVNRSGRLIVIGTQVLEQSLDIDFDVLITDLAPMDLLLQRIGRLHRHENQRLPKLDQATCYVMESGENLESGAEYIYGAYLLERTKALLPDAIRLPDDISELVQNTYDFTYALDNQIDLSAMKTDFLTFVEHKKARAKTFLLPKIKPRDSLGARNGLLSMSTVAEESVDPSVRDSEMSFEVILVQITGSSVRLLNSEEFIVRDQIPSASVAVKLAKSTIRMPRALCQQWNIDSTINELEVINRENFWTWQESPLLKGELILAVDEEGCVDLNGYTLCYDKEIGLTTQRKEVDE